MTRNRFLGSSLVALTMLCGTQSASALSLTDLGLGYNVDLSTFTTARTVTVSDFWSALAGVYTATPTTAYRTVYDYFYTVMDTAAKAASYADADELGGLGGGNQVAGGQKTKVVNTVWSGTLTFTGGNTVTFQSTALAAPQSFTSVPGPVAAAGLPALLGLMGFAAWKRRRAAA